MPENLLDNFINFIPEIVAALVIFFLGIYLAIILSRGLRIALTRRQTNPQAVDLLVKISRWTMIILVITIALQQVGFNLTAFLTGIGIVGFTVGFALQDVSKNFVSGLLLLIQQPFNVGEAIEVAGFSGTVIAINLRATEMHTFDGRVVLIPNADVLTNPITNFSRAASRRVALEVGVDYESDLEEVRRVALDALLGMRGLIGTPAQQVSFHTFGVSAIGMTVYYWIDTVQTDPVTAKDEGLVAIKSAFERAGINMPYPVLPARQLASAD